MEYINNFNDLKELSELIGLRNMVERDAFKLMKRSFQLGHVGEFIASRIFNIVLNKSASAKGNDGYFQKGHLKYKTVNIKFYSKYEGLLDLNIANVPDYYIVLVGGNSNEKFIRPWSIASVYLFNAAKLIASLKQNNKKIGIASSVKKKYWQESMIYPGKSNEYILNDNQIDMLNLFNGSVN